MPEGWRQCAAPAAGTWPAAAGDVTWCTLTPHGTSDSPSDLHHAAGRAHFSHLIHYSFSCCRGTARRSVSAEILSTDAQLYRTKIPFDKACSLAWMTLKITRGHRKWRCSIGHISLYMTVVCNNNVSNLHCFWYIITFSVTLRSPTILIRQLKS